MKIGGILALVVAFAALRPAVAENVVDYRYVVDHDIDVRAEDTRVADGAYIEAPRHRFAVTGEGTTHFTMAGGRLVGTSSDGKFTMPCDDTESAVCLGYGPGYVVADLAGGEIDCPNGMFTVARQSYTTCMVTGTVIRCRGFRLQAGKTTGYATFILGQGGELDITGEWGIRSYHDPDIHHNYAVGDPDFRYYFEMRGGKIRFEGSYNHPGKDDLDHHPCLIMAPDTVSEFEVVGDDNVVHYAGQLQGEGTLRKTGTGKLILASGFIRNEGTIVLEEGSMEMYTSQTESLFWGNLVVKPGTKLILLGRDSQDVPDLIQVCRSGMLTVEDGAEVWYRNQQTGTTKLVDLTANATNGGYIENRSTYRVGVSMNLGTVTWSLMKDEIDDPYTGAYAEHSSKWGRMREINSALGSMTVTDIMRIYARSDLQKFIKLSVWAGTCAAVQSNRQLTNGNERVTNYYLDDGFSSWTSKNPHAGPVVATNYLYQKEQVALPTPDCARNWQIQLADIPYAEFSIYLIFSANDLGKSGDVDAFAPVKVRLTTADGLYSSNWTNFTYRGGVTQIGEETWGGSEGLVSRTNLVEGVNYLRIHFSPEQAENMGLFGLDDLNGVTIDIAPGPVSITSDTGGHHHNVRCCLAGVQIVPDGEPMPELDINEYTAFVANRNIYALRDGDDFRLDFTSTNENIAIGFVHSISNDIHIAPRILVAGKEWPRLPGETSRYRFDAVNTDKIELDVKYLPWRDNQTNDLTMAQLGWVTNRWGGSGELAVSNRTWNSASAIAGADSDGDRLMFQEEWAMDCDLTADSNPMRLCIINRAVSNDCLWLDVEYTRTEDGVVLTNSSGRAIAGWTGVTNGLDNAAWLQLGMKRGMEFGWRQDALRRVEPASRGPNPQFTTSITNTIAIPLIEMTNRFFRAMMEK